MNYVKLWKVLTCLIVLCFAVSVTEAKRKRSYTQLEYNLMSDERMCQRKKCGRKPKGSWCEVVVDDKGARRPSCVCPTSCNATDTSPVCSVFGRQYDNKCFLHKEACRKRRNIKMAMEGPCIASQRKCKKEELRQFPFRLLDWFIHLKDTDEFGTVDPRKSITTISLEQRQDVADWKFKTLDKNGDGKLTGKELKRFRFALMPLEHCAKDFFKKCDKDKNRKINSGEWLSCLVEQSWDWFQQRAGSRHANSQKEQESAEEATIN